MSDIYILNVKSPEEFRSKVVEWLLQQSMKAAVDVNIDNVYGQRIRSSTYNEAASFISRIQIEG